MADEQHLILIHCVEQSQKHGVFSLAEADILCRCKNILIKGTLDPDITAAMAVDNLIRGVQRGQTKGVFTLDEASSVYKVVQSLKKS